MLALFLFGGETLRDFAFALLIGTLSGTYSSVFIAGPVLMLRKEREPVYRARLRRIRDALGHVPAYAVATAGAPVDVEPGQARRGAASVTAPQDPTQVSRDEFDDLVRNLGIEEGQAPPPEPAATPSGTRPPGGRRARGRPTAGGTPQPPAEGGESGQAPGAEKPKRPRNRKHGRPR